LVVRLFGIEARMARLIGHVSYYDEIVFPFRPEST